MVRTSAKHVLVICLLLASSAAHAQEVRASITGSVTDPTGAPVPGAKVTATNLASNVSVATESSTTGTYLTPFLPPGAYRLTVENSGFKRFVRENIVLQSQDRPRVDVTLEIGELAQSVTVNDAVSQLQTETASRSQVLANEIISNMPTQGRNPFQIAWAAAGVVKSGSWRYLRSFDIGGTSGISISGGRERENEVLLDGISNVRANRTVVSVPTTDSVEEFKVHTNTYDAQYGRTGGGVVSIVTRGGGNQVHGTAFEYFQNDKLNGNQTELNRAGIARPPNHINQFGAQMSGPVYIPKLFDGRNRVFWMLSWESMRQRSADPGVTSFPLAEWRNGDFSTLFNGAGQQVLIYDPRSTRPDGTRTPIPGNRLATSQIDPVAKAVLGYYPLPRTLGDGPAHINNFPYPSRWIASFDQFAGRTDVSINNSNKIFFRYGENPFQEYRAIVFGLDNPGEPTGNAPLLRNGRNLVINYTSTLSPTMTFDLRTGLSRWEEAGGSTLGAGFDPKKLGLDPALVGQFTRFQFPRFDIQDFQSVGSDAFGPGTMDTYSLQPNLNMVRGKHFLKFGAEGRLYNRNESGRGYPSGQFSFTKNWTQANANRADAVSGNGLATMLLGLPWTAQVQKNIDPAYRHYYWAGFIHDDWKINQKLTLNIGLRWDLETNNYERYDRNLLGLDYNATSPIASRVQGLSLKGVPLFAGKDGQMRTAFTNDKNNWQPRVGVAYKLRDKWVLRGGYGLYYLGQDENGFTNGFSRTTSAVVSTDGLTPLPGLTTGNAFIGLPGGKLLDPIGSSLGALSFLGEGLPGNYLNRQLPYSHQYSFDVQRELPGGYLFEIGYSGNLTRALPVGFNANYVPASDLARRTATGAIDTAYYTAQVPNPMAGLIPNNAALNGATIQRQILSFAYPQYAGVQFLNAPVGRNRFDGMQVKVTKRLSHGLSFLSSYSIGKNLEQTRILNAQDFSVSNWQNTKLVKESNQNIDAPQKFVIAGLYQLPFGKGQRFAGSANRIVNGVIGGWQLAFDVTYQSGWVVDYPNAPQNAAGSAKLDPGQRTVARWFNTSLWRTADGRPVATQEPFTLRSFPLRFGDVRRPGYENWDTSLSKFFPITEKMKLQFRFEMVNMMNHPWLANIQSVDVTNPGFGQLNPTQGNLPRFIKLVTHLNW
ncbi:MAG: TonB-dependent receptor [Bryobacteraceae bacterium]